MKPYISTNDAGICNRIKNLLSVMMLSEDNHYVYWPKNGYSRASFSNLFENKIEVKKIPYTNIFYQNFNIFFNPQIRQSSILYVKDDYNLPENFSSPLYDEKKKFWYRYNMGITIDYQYHKIDSSIKNDYLKQIKKLKFNKKILNTVNEFSNNYFDNEMVGLQIRTWIDDPRRKNMFDINSYKNIIKQISKEKKIYITTDNLEVLEELINFSNAEIISFTKDSAQKNKNSNSVSSYVSAEDDFNVFVELLLLSKCAKIYGSYLSNFPEVAWWLGGCKARVEIVNMPIKKENEIIHYL